MSEKETVTVEKGLHGKELAVANEYLNPLRPYGAVIALREMTRRIMALDHGKEPMNGGEAAHFAQVAVSEQLNPFTGEIWAWVTVRGDKRQLTIMPGRKGLLRHAHAQALERETHFWPEYEQVTDEDERKALFIPTGALAFKCALRDDRQIETWTKALNAVIDAAKLGIEIDRKGISHMPFTFGLGILTQQEITSLDKNSSNKMTHVERCQKRAYMAALKQLFDLPLGGSVGAHGETMDDYIPEAEWRVLEEDEESDAPELTEEEKEALSERAKAGADSLYGADSDEPEIIEPKSKRLESTPTSQATHPHRECERRSTSRHSTKTCLSDGSKNGWTTTSIAEHATLTLNCHRNSPQKPQPQTGERHTPRTKMLSAPLVKSGLPVKKADMSDLGKLARIAMILANPFPELGRTGAQREVVRLASRGLTTAEIAEEAGLSPTSIGTMLKRLLKDTGMTKSDLPAKVFEQIEKVLRE
jgi:DNA-binding CsgD family transcriptional regulator